MPQVEEAPNASERQVYGLKLHVPRREEGSPLPRRLALKSFILIGFSNGDPRATFGKQKRLSLGWAFGTWDSPHPLVECLASYPVPLLLLQLPVDAHKGWLKHLGPCHLVEKCLPSAYPGAGYCRHSGSALADGKINPSRSLPLSLLSAFNKKNAHQL